MDILDDNIVSTAAEVKSFALDDTFSANTNQRLIALDINWCSWSVVVGARLPGAAVACVADVRLRLVAVVASVEATATAAGSTFGGAEVKSAINHDDTGRVICEIVHQPMALVSSYIITYSMLAQDKLDILLVCARIDRCSIATTTGSFGKAESGTANLGQGQRRRGKESEERLKLHDGPFG